MKVVLWSLSLIVLASSQNVTVEIHNCMPMGHNGLCWLWSVFYDRHRNETHIFPTNYSHIRIGNEGWFKGGSSVIPKFGPALYTELGHPQVIEINNVGMRALEIPRKLQYGNFAMNYLRRFSVERGESDPVLTFLDLASNFLLKITSISSLINLEGLYLTNNDLEVLEFNLFKNLTKLKVLSLHYNNIHHMSGESLPISLTYLGLYSNEIQMLNYSDLYSPALKELNIESNHLQTFDASAAILAMPNLKKIPLSGNIFSFDSLKPELDILDRHNISYVSRGDEISCDYDEDEVEGICIRRKYNTEAWLKATGLSALTVLVAVVFVLMVRWVLIAMSK